MSKPIRLVSHPETPSNIPTPVVWVGRTGGLLRLTFRIPGDTSAIAFPQRLEPFTTKEDAGRRADGLWERTCFEAFIRPEGQTSYIELNFSPSGHWAAYQFDARREGRKNAEIATPGTIPTDSPNRFEISAHVEIPGWADADWELNLTAVIEEKDGTKSYWALAHPASGSPDFHDPSCFLLELPSASPQSSPRT